MPRDSAIDIRDVQLARLRRAWHRGTDPTPRAFALAEQCAAAGLAEAQYILGLMLGSTKQPGDEVRARHWFEKAADGG